MNEFDYHKGQTGLH